MKWSPSMSRNLRGTSLFQISLKHIYLYHLELLRSSSYHNTVVHHLGCINSFCVMTPSPEISNAIFKWELVKSESKSIKKIWFMIKQCTYPILFPNPRVPIPSPINPTIPPLSRLKLHNLWNLDFSDSFPTYTSSQNTVFFPFQISLTRPLWNQSPSPEESLTMSLHQPDNLPFKSLGMTSTPLSPKTPHT